MKEKLQLTLQEYKRIMRLLQIIIPQYTGHSRSGQISRNVTIS